MAQIGADDIARILREEIKNYESAVNVAEVEPARRRSSVLVCGCGRNGVR